MPLGFFLALLGDRGSMCDGIDNASLISGRADSKAVVIVINRIIKGTAPKMR